MSLRDNVEYKLKRNLKCCANCIWLFNYLDQIKCIKDSRSRFFYVDLVGMCNRFDPRLEEEE